MTRAPRLTPVHLLTVNGNDRDARRYWAETLTPTEHIVARYADLKTRVEAASALLGMGLSIAAQLVLDPGITKWPTLAQARTWQRQALRA